MLALIARWTHNVLLASMALLTIVLVVSATQYRRDICTIRDIVAGRARLRRDV